MHSQTALRPGVLVCEDDRSVACYVRSVVTSCGAGCHVVPDGEAAVDAAAARDWDLILMDIGLPGIDGIEATRRIKRIQRENKRWVPLLLFTATVGTATWVEGLRAGADDVLPKGIDAALLKAKLHGMLALSRQAHLLADRTRELGIYRDAAEHEKAFGRHVLAALTRRGQLDDPALFVWQREVGGLSGDLVAHRRVGDAHYLLLADAMGHGMSAALVTILVADMFHAMAAKSLPLSDIAIELNRKLVRTLPPGNFVGAVLVRTQDARAEAINAGMPPCLLLRNGGVAGEMTSKNLPFGVEDFGEAPQLDSVELRPRDRIALMSDGVHEGPLQRETLVDAMSGGCPGPALDAVDSYADDATCAVLSP